MMAVSGHRSCSIEWNGNTLYVLSIFQHVQMCLSEIKIIYRIAQPKQKADNTFS